MSTGIQPTLFDYAALDAETRNIALYGAEQIRSIAKRAVVEIGRELLTVKAALDHGMFERWLAAEFQWSYSSAARFMQVARVFGENYQIDNFAASALYLLAAPSTPDPARNEALERADAGESITYSKARQIVNEYKSFDNVLEDANDAVIDGRDPMEPPDDEPDWAAAYRHIAPITEPPKANHQLINASTNNEWYTPRRYLDAVHAVMGGVDLDPASNPTANEQVRATNFYTIDDDGYTQPWAKRVFLNPPYGTTDGESNQARWSRRLIKEYRAGHVTEAVLLVNAVPGNQWFAPLWDFPICFPDHRIRFYNTEIEAGQPTHSNALVYLGKNIRRFIEVFSEFGTVAARLAVEGADVSVSVKL